MSSIKPLAPNPCALSLCVAIHDVAPATWPECLILLRTIRAVADIPLTWLVVPRYHDSNLRSRSSELMLERLLEAGHELALHGYTHRDAAGRGKGLGSRFLRTVYTQGEGEFSALDVGEASRRIDLGMAWLRERQWPLTGFVAPAWLMSAGAWQAVRHFPFSYTTTWRDFHLLPSARVVHAPALVYAARNVAGRMLSPPLSGALAMLSRKAPLVRLALHPRDAHHPALLRHAQKLIAELLVQRVALTKLGFAQQLAGTASGADRDISSRAQPPSC